MYGRAAVIRINDIRRHKSVDINWILKKVVYVINHSKNITIAYSEKELWIRDVMWIDNSST